MKRLLAISLLALSLSTVTLAGEVPFPPLPPPCTENCTQSAPTLTPLEILIIEIAVSVITKR